MNFQQNLSKEVWENSYKWETDSSIEDTFKRVAKSISLVEKKSIQSEIEAKYFNMLSAYEYVPGGRIISNAGTGLKGTTYINCFVSSLKGRDSIDGIYDELKRQAKILKSEGGYGFCCDALRPRGAYIKGTGGKSPGAVKILDLWNTSSDVITAGAEQKESGKQKGKKKNRKGAQMVTMSCWHPSIEEFITAKQVPNRLTKFNMSAMPTNKFMHAVKNNLPWELIFPDTNHPKYDTEWTGDIEKWKKNKYPVIVYKTFTNANELWDLIMTSTYNRNEPGVLFIDRINELNNLNYCEHIDATNPCGEQSLPPDGSCNLGSINLTKFINANSTDFDYEKLKKKIPDFVRFQDAVTDASYYPLPEQRKEALNKRRIGIGYLGYGSALYLLKIPYGSKKALALTDKLCRFVVNEIYRASALLAKEKGKFPAYSKDAYLKSKFITNALDKETVELIKKYGVRTSHSTSLQPTGNTAIFAEVITGGLEPVIDPEYVRTVIIGEVPTHINLPIVNWEHQKISGENKNNWLWVKEGDDFLLKCESEGSTYKFDKNRGLTKEEKVYEYAVLKMGDEFDPKADWATTIFNLGVDAHVDTMAVFAKYVDSSISKTINLPNDYPYDEFKNIYMKAYDSGYVKGFTTYRWGTMAQVISSVATTTEKKPTLPTLGSRPDVLNCDVHRISVHGEKWIVFIGLMEGKPYEVFAGKIDSVDLPSNVSRGILTKVKSRFYNFESEGEILLKDISGIFNNDTHESITRLISSNLRYGVPIEFIVDQLTKSKGVITDFSKSIIRALKKYIKEGVDSSGKCEVCNGSLVFTEGCFKCKDCGATKC